MAAESGRYDGFVARLSQLIPLGRMARTDEYRSAIQFLCSDASSYMTGQNIVMDGGRSAWRSEEHTSELQSLMRISYAVFCLKKKNKIPHTQTHHDTTNKTKRTTQLTVK